MRSQDVGPVLGDQSHRPAQDQQTGRSRALVLGELLAADQGDDRLAQPVHRVRKRVRGPLCRVHGSVREQLTGQFVQIHGSRLVHAPILLRRRRGRRTG